MDTTKRRILEIPGHASLTLNVTRLIENFVNVFFQGNRRPVFQASLTPKTKRTFLEMGKEPTNVFIKAEKMASNPELWTSTERDMRQLIYTDVGGFVGSLMAEKEEIPDYGYCVMQDLAEFSPYWSIVYDVAPALGYPRPRLRLDADPYAKYDGDIDSTLLLPSPGSDFNDAIAHFLLFADLPAYDVSLIPKTQTTVAGHTGRDAPIGTLASLAQQAKEVHAMAVPYHWQGSCLVAGLTKRWYDMCLSLAKVRDSQYNMALELAEKNRQQVMSLPVHGLIAMMMNTAQDGTVMTQYGERELLYRLTPPRPSPLAGSEDPCKVLDGFMINSALYEAVHAMKFPRPVKDVPGEGKGSIIGVDCSNAYTWDFRTGRPDGVISANELAERVRGSGALLERAKAFVSKIGWSSSGKAGNIGKIDTINGEFTVCDGRSYTKDPARVLFGLSPCLSFANVKVNGTNRRVFENWNEGAGRINSSVVAVKGFRGVTYDSVVYERIYMPLSMSMGEPNLNIVRADMIDRGPLGSPAIKHYRSMQGMGYLQAFYVDFPDPEEPVVQTDWDPIGTGASLPALQTAWISSIGDQLVAFDNGLLVAETSDGTSFWYRLLLNITHDYTVDLYDELGNHTERLDWHAELLTTEEIAFPASSDPLEAVVRALPSPRPTGSSTLDKHITAEAEVKTSE